MKSFIQELLVAGTFMEAIAEALITKSLTESLVPDTLFSFSLIFMRLSTETWTVT